jgi:hypothetical protein
MMHLTKKMNQCIRIIHTAWAVAFREALLYGSIQVLVSSSCLVINMTVFINFNSAVWWVVTAKRFAVLVSQFQSCFTFFFLSPPVSATFVQPCQTRLGAMCWGTWTSSNILLLPIIIIIILYRSFVFSLMNETFWTFMCMMYIRWLVTTGTC